MKRNIKAFPRTNDCNQLGMDLRDYFAAKVVQGDLSKNGCMSVYETARFAYQVADAMLEVRDENNQSV